MTQPSPESSRYDLIKSAFLESVDLTPDERREWLDRNCPAELREDVEALLRSHDAAPEFESAAAELMQRLGCDSTPSNQETVVPLDTQLDEFRLVRRLGRGGMGDVYLAEDRMLQRAVAVKVLPPGPALTETAIARFRKEAVIVAQLRHPAIVPIHRVGAADGVHYLVMDLVAGPTLAGFMEIERSMGRTGGRLGARTWLCAQAERIARIADALDHVHQAGIIHRDVKPSNILLDGDGTPYLSDFGIAKDLNRAGVTSAGAGTVDYMSPEQALATSTEIDHRSDIFSLGVTLYELLTLTQPFPGESEAIKRQNIIFKPAPPVRDANPAIDKDLATIVHKALEKEPKDRYPSAAHFAADLRSWTVGAPILARPPGVWRRIREWSKAHRAAALAAVMVVLVGAVVALGLMQRQAWKGSTTEVVITTDVPVERIEYALMDLETGTFGPRRRLGRAPYTGRLPRGNYMFIAIADDGFEVDTISYVPSADDRPGEDERTGMPDTAPVELALEVRRARTPPENMIAIAGGEFQTEDGTVTIAPFIMDRHEVSNAEYGLFLEANPRHPKPPHWDVAATLPDRPAAGITYRDAVAFATWTGKRLPTAHEWEWAMRLAKPGVAPWSTKPAGLPEVDAVDIAGRLFEYPLEIPLYQQYTVPVASVPAAASASGILHPYTNVREIVAGVSRQFGLAVVISRGQSWSDEYRPFRFANQHSNPWRKPNLEWGFRCVRTDPLTPETNP